MSNTSIALVDQLTLSLSRYGFDIIKPFPVQRYNSTIPKGIPHLPTFERQSTLGILIGNTKTIWPHFIDFLKRDPTCIPPEPFDSYVRQSLTRCLQDIIDRDIKYHLHFTFDTGEKFVAFQQLAHYAAHFAYYEPPLGLCISKEHGAWFALRACVVFDVTWVNKSPHELKCPLTDERILSSKTLLKSILEKPGGMQGTWQDWVKLRDLVSNSSQINNFKYPNAMMRYHYLKQINILEQELVNHCQKSIRT